MTGAAFYAALPAAEARLDDIAEQALDEAKRYSNDAAPLFALVAKTRELSGR